LFLLGEDEATGEKTSRWERDGRCLHTCTPAQVIVCVPINIKAKQQKLLVRQQHVAIEILKKIYFHIFKF